MKLSDLTLRQIAVGVPTLCLLNWAVLQFAVLPNMSGDERKRLYPAWVSSPYVYGVCTVFVVVALWLVFRHRGASQTHERRLVLFAMALGSLCGMMMIAAIRLAWHI